MSLERKINRIKSLFDKGQLHEALNVYIRSGGSDFKTEYLETFIDRIVEIARESFIDGFTCESFFCTKCREVIKDPVTLKCGHTFSKKCALSEAKNFSFTCTKCSINYSFSSISQLKTSVTILSVVEKLQEKLHRYKNNPITIDENQVNKVYEAQKYFIKSCDIEMRPEVKLSSLHATISLGYFNKGSMLFNFGKYIESFKALLISLALDPNAHSAKLVALEVFRKTLQTYRSSYNGQTISKENKNLFSLKFRNTLGHSERRLRNSGSNDSLHSAEDDRSSSDEEDTKVLDNELDTKDLHLMLDTYFEDMNSLAAEMNLASKIDASWLDKKEFECSLCMRILYQPVTTTCGHTFCKVCLNRCLDHKPTCPLCKASLALFLAERVQNTTEFLEIAIKSVFRTEYEERHSLHLEEIREFHNAGKDPKHEIPLFICTVALPTVPCPLHIFEPRYRLMIRRCVESGGRKFGMCGVVDGQVAQFGTMLEIRDVQYFPDGRSVVDTIGHKRFKVLRKGVKDGYDTGAIEFLEDQLPCDLDLQCIQENHDKTYNISKVWLNHLPEDTRIQIFQHFGPMPCVETNYASSPNGPSWLWWMLAILPVETRVKVVLLSLTSLLRRLELLYRILDHFLTNTRS